MVLDILVVNSYRGARMNKNLLFLGVAGIAVVGGIGAYLMIASKEPAPPVATPVPATATPVPKNNYPQEVKETFVNSCVSAGATAAVCECMIDEFEEKMTFQEFYEVDRQMAETGEAPPLVQEIALSCRNAK